MLSRSRREISSRWPIREGRPLKNHTCEHGEASSMWPMRSRRTLLTVTSTPHLSQITPRCFMRLYLPQRHSVGHRSKNARAEEAVPLRLGNFAMRPATDLLWRCQHDADCVEVGNGAGKLKRVRTEHSDPPWQAFF